MLREASQCYGIMGILESYKSGFRLLLDWQPCLLPLVKTAGHVAHEFGKGKWSAFRIEQLVERHIQSRLFGAVDEDANRTVLRLGRPYAPDDARALQFRRDNVISFTSHKTTAVGVGMPIDVHILGRVIPRRPIRARRRPARPRCVPFSPLGRGWVSPRWGPLTGPRG